MTVLGGPKGITTNFKAKTFAVDREMGRWVQPPGLEAAVQQAFCCQGVPLLEAPGHVGLGAIASEKSL